MIEYRFLDNKDTEWFRKIVRKFRQQEVTDEKALSLLSDPNIQIQLASCGGDVCGYTLSYRLPRLDMGADMMAIYHCFVEEKYRRQGIAETMMRNLLDYCKKNSLHYVSLITQTDNDAANSLYHKLGGQLHPKNRNVYYWYITGKPQI